MIENPNYERPSMVMLMGDRTRDPAFQEVLVKALRELLEEIPETLSEGPIGVAAKGVAEMAKRASSMPNDVEHYRREF